MAATQQQSQQPAMTAKELRAAMASLEDVDDVEAGRALEKEAADEQLEFDDIGVSNRVRAEDVAVAVVFFRIG